MKSYRDGSWDNHTEGTTQYSQERGKHDHLEQRLSDTRKPKSHPSSNTQCPITRFVALAPVGASPRDHPR